MLQLELKPVFLTRLQNQKKRKEKTHDTRTRTPVETRFSFFLF